MKTLLAAALMLLTVPAAPTPAVLQTGAASAIADAEKMLASGDTAGARP